MIKVKKIVNTGAGEAGIRCYKCSKNRASFYLMRESEDRSVDVPLCKVCLSAYLNYLDERIILHHYNLEHPDNKVE
jgi:protein-arginine kinase activator protein McsA